MNLSINRILLLSIPLLAAVFANASVKSEPMASNPDHTIYVEDDYFTFYAGVRALEDKALVKLPVLVGDNKKIELNLLNCTNANLNTGEVKCEYQATSSINHESTNYKGLLDRNPGVLMERKVHGKGSNNQFASDTYIVVKL